MSKVDNFISLASAALDHSSGREISFCRRQSDNRLMVVCTNEDFKIWFEHIDGINVFPQIDGFGAEIYYLGHLFVSNYFNDCGDYDDI